MNIYFRKCQYAIIGLVVLVALAQGARVPAAINENVTNSHTFTTSTVPNAADIVTLANDGATVIVKHDTSPVPTTPGALNWLGTIQMDKSGTFQIDNYSGSGPTLSMEFILSGVLTGNGGFTKTGTGTFTLAGNASGFTGNIIINAGTFAIAATGQLSDGENTVILGGGTLDISGKAAPPARTITIASLSGNGTVKIGDNNKLMVKSKDTNDHTIIDGISFSGNASSVFEKTGGGSLVVNNDISSFGGTVKVTDGSILSGTGKLNKVVIGSDAALAPGAGADIGEFITISDLTIENGGLLKLRVDSDNYDYITGLTKAVINGTIEIDAAAGTYNGQEYKIFQDNSGQGKAYGFSGMGDVAPTDFVFKQKFLDGYWEDANNENVLKIKQKDNYFSKEIFAGKVTPPSITHNQLQVAKAFDKSGGSLWGPKELLSGWEGENAWIRDAYRQIASDLRANSMMLGQWQTSRYGLNHLDLTNCGYSQGNAVWLEFIHQTTNFESDGNSGPYGISRTGFLIGSEERRVDTIYGFFVGYSYPFLYSQGDRVEVNDLQFGFYGGSKVADVLETKLFVGYGHQGYKSRRFFRGPDDWGGNVALEEDWDDYWEGRSNRINGKYSGDSMSMSLEFGVPLSSGFFCLRPVVALDSDLTWQYGFGESGNTGLELWYDRSFLNRSFIRTGLTMQLGSVDQCDTLALMGRAYYGHQVFGDPYPVSRSRFLGEEYRMTIHGVDPGRDYVDLGIGLRWNIDTHRSFYGDYDFTAFSRSNAHSGTIGFMQRW